MTKSKKAKKASKSKMMMQKPMPMMSNTDMKKFHASRGKMM